MYLNILDSIDLERKRRVLGSMRPDKNAANLWAKALESLASDQGKKELARAHRFMLDIEYHHEGLSSEIYCAHPIRVASMSVLALGDRHGWEVGIVGLLHNALEVTDLTKNSIAENFGLSVADQISMLTVDRSLQWNAEYKAEYYRRISTGPIPARVVKLFDKIDNLFVLGLNSNEAVRRKYLKEIEDYVLPLAIENVPGVESYLGNLIEDTRALGYIDRSKWDLEEGADIGSEY